MAVSLATVLASVGMVISDCDRAEVLSWARSLADDLFGLCALVWDPPRMITGFKRDAAKSSRSDWLDRLCLEDVLLFLREELSKGVLLTLPTDCSLSLPLVELSEETLRPRNAYLP